MRARSSTAFKPFLQVVDLRRETAVAGLEPGVVLALQRDRGLQAPHARHAPISPPELELQHNERGQEDGDHGLHEPTPSLVALGLFPIGIGPRHLTPATAQGHFTLAEL